MRFLKVVVLFLLMTLTWAGCAPKKSQETRAEVPTSSSQVSADERLVLESTVNFVILNDPIGLDERNDVGFTLDGKKELHVRYRFKVANPKNMRVLWSEPALTCQGAPAVSSIRVFLRAGKEIKEVGFETFAIEPQTQYILELVQSIECKKGSGVFQTVLWVGKNPSVEPGLAVFCKTQAGEQVLSFTEGALVALNGNRYSDSYKFCGEALPGKAQCRRWRSGLQENLNCTYPGEKKSFNFFFDPSRGVGGIECQNDGRSVQSMPLESCTKRVIDHRDYGSL